MRRGTDIYFTFLFSFYIQKLNLKMNCFVIFVTLNELCCLKEEKFFDFFLSDGWFLFWQLWFR
jgi:hypothetical protein